MMEPALVRIACIMARNARFGGCRGWLTPANPGVIVAANIEMARRGRNLGRTAAPAAWRDENA